ncbi:hypothetical protein DPMN_153525 [Dreissena polymorpha]|uniref:Uncharacterized protein n=1 Tax=Dreissena polymorpha TaxID=45954 RepID=A0A9D4FLQ4_DREPO|nr:hypothetical protein DPMN_153525 [Dreissena polymorpha]
MNKTNYIVHAEQSSETFVLKYLYPAFSIRAKRPGLAAEPKSRIEPKRDWWSLYLMVKRLELLDHNLLSLAIAAVAMGIIIRNPAV